MSRDDRSHRLRSRVRVWFVLDATHTFDDQAPDGGVVPTTEIARTTGINLQDEFAEVVTTEAACA